MAKIDINDVARRLGGTVKGKVETAGGYFGALALAAEVERRFRQPEGGGRATDPTWTEQRLVRMKPSTLRRLEEIAQQLSEAETRVAPLQVAALLLEGATSGERRAVRSRPVEDSLEEALGALRRLVTSHGEEAERQAEESEFIEAPERLLVKDVEVERGDRRPPRLTKAA